MPSQKLHIFSRLNYCTNLKDFYFYIAYCIMTLHRMLEIENIDSNNMVFIPQWSRQWLFRWIC